MEKRLIIHYFKNKCIGNGNCCVIDPSNFSILEDKAILKNAKKKDGEVDELEFETIEKGAALLIEAARSCPANAIRVFDVEKNIDVVTVQLEKKEMKEVKAQYDDNKEFVLDHQGYFLIKLDREEKNIEVGFCNERNKLVLKVVGKKPIDIYTTILNKEKLDIRKDHAAYLGRELQKAYIALNMRIDYVQDDELDFNSGK